MLMLKRSKSFRRRPLIKMPSIRPTTAYWVCHFTRKVFQKNQFYSACSPGSPARSERNSSSSSSLGRRRSSRKESVVSRDSSSHFLYLDGKDSLEVDKFSAALSRSSSHNRGHRGSVSSSGPDREQEEEIVSASAQEELLQDYEEAYKQDLHNLFSPTSIDQPKPEADAGEAEESAMKQETPEEEMRKEKMPEEETRRARKGSAPLVRELLRPTRVMFDTSQRESARGCRVTWRVAGTRGEQRRDPLRPRTRSVVMARSMSKKEGESVDDLITLYAQLKKDEEARQRRGLVASGTCKTSEDGGSM
ncbi:hypothetical protein GUITHDRAFT_149880 [Guillardia theta CCMP2712]|uniref:Uncharacterized protein n=1 Tax=Guillardia theta (strain CCMP2712) TaxID=905079 RepID=L1K2Q3_GUITC|nr:hypothetical protein GUITHDRAFT_149880 [Guillardia theta CCMP2712]EKX54847.1 hypothetical protein GUITHDRAFT_149880 [Guillardia theta CCMP2712]|eukprot:XP_005841827.1 hypothetical protein GUITHDRAFT_149880 [Guillardia theta CCMP2712]